MTAERIAQLEMELARERAKTARVEAELAAERAENASLRQQMESILVRLREVEGQLAKDSQNSSKPPSSDGPGRKRRSQRHQSERKTGGQPGHPGQTLMQLASPDEVVCHRPLVCCHCQQPLEGVTGTVKERRQIHDLPEVRLLVREHQVEEVCCSRCGQASRGSFPAGVEAEAAVWAEPARLRRVSASVPVGAAGPDVRTARRPVRLSALGGNAHRVGAAGSADPGTDRRAHWRLDQRESTAA